MQVQDVEKRQNESGALVCLSPQKAGTEEKRTNELKTVAEQYRNRSEKHCASSLLFLNCFYQNQGSIDACPLQTPGKPRHVLS
jgi:hypothetical protein